MALLWTAALILLGVATGGGSKSSSAGNGAAAAPVDGSTTPYTIKPASDVHLNGTCSWRLGAYGRPLELRDSNHTPRHPVCQPVVNETTVAASGAWAPWTHRPVCTEARADEWGTVQQYCVFTDASFRGGRGISVIAAPHVAAAMADALDDSGIPPRLRDHPSTALHGDVALEHGSVAHGNAFAVQEVPGHGKGVVAARHIGRGELVFVDYATVLSQNTFTAPGTAAAPADPEQIMQLLQVAAKQLPTAQQTRVHALAHSLGGERIRDILRTNVFGGIAIAGEPHIGLFPLGSVRGR